MKKIFVIPAVIGLLAVPSVVVAQHGADDNNPNDIRQEDRQQDRRQDRRNDNAATPAVPNAQNLDENDNDEDDNNGVNQVPVNTNAQPVTQDQATAIAMGVFPGKTISKVQSESEGGSPVFSVRFTDGSRVDVRVSDGAVIRTKTENQNSDNRSDNSGRGHHGDNDNDNDDSGAGNDNDD